jgi:hypothetical protein
VLAHPIIVALAISTVAFLLYFEIARLRELGVASKRSKIRITSQLRAPSVRRVGSTRLSVFPARS